MFEKGEYIVYGSSGVCRIEDITTMQMAGVSSSRLYYVLEPLSQRGGRIFTPVDNQKTRMRKILTKEEASSLIREIPRIEGLWISSEKLREDRYKECMKTCDCREWIKIIKTLYTRRMERSAQGKRITQVDEKYLRMAEDFLYSELEIPLGISKEDMADYITDQIENGCAAK